jgi:hypothetical protein
MENVAFKQHSQCSTTGTGTDIYAEKHMFESGMVIPDLESEFLFKSRFLDPT